MRLPLIFAVYPLILCVLPTSDVPLLPHPVEAAVEPAAHSSIHYGTLASTSHHAVELHSEQPVYLYVVEGVEEVAEQAIEEVQVQIEGVPMEGEQHIELLQGLEMEEVMAMVMMDAEQKIDLVKVEVQLTVVEDGWED